MHYKFLNGRDVDRVVIDGTMMISSLGYFRGLENTAGGIGDPLEGGTELTISDAITATKGSPELDMLNSADIGLGMFKQFAKVEGGGTISFGSGTRFVHLAPQFHIYSFAAGDLDTLVKELCGKEGYDACLKIKDPIALAHACFREGVMKSLGGQSVGRVNDLFQDIVGGTVEYVPRSINITEGKVVAPDPFKKEERFRLQYEERFVFVPRDGRTIADQRLICAIPNPTLHFVIEFRDRAAP